MFKSIDQHLKLYKEHLRIQNYSPNTIKSYITGLRQFLEFKESQRIEGEINQEQARQFILFRYDQGAQWQSINNIYSSLLKYFREVLEVEWSVKMIKRPRRQKTLPILLDKNEVKNIIEHFTMYKYQVFFTLVYSTGIRLSEARHIRFEHIDRSSHRILIKKGKGAVDRYVDLSPEILSLLSDYYKRERPQKYLFNGAIEGDILSCRSVQNAVRKAVLAAKVLKKVSTHTFRHCFATHHLEQGTNIVYVQKQMGHKQLKTTAKYINLCQNYHRKIVHPIQTIQINYMNKSRR